MDGRESPKASPRTNASNRCQDKDKAKARRQGESEAEGPTGQERREAEEDGRRQRRQRRASGCRQGTRYELAKRGLIERLDRRAPPERGARPSPDDGLRSARGLSGACGVA